MTFRQAHGPSEPTPMHLTPRSDRVTVVPRRHRDPTPPAPQPTSVELLAELGERLAGMGAAQAAFRDEVRDRLAALDTAVFRAEDAADCASMEAQAVRGTLGHLIEDLDDLID